MKVLYVYRCPAMGYSIENVFKPIESKMKKKCECESITFTEANYNPKSLIKNIRTIKKYMRKNPEAIIHITGAEHYLVPFLRKYKTVITVHDLGFYTENKKSIRLILKYFLWIKSLVMANKVVFISNKSLKEAEMLIKLKKEQANVILNPVSEEFRCAKKVDENDDVPVILHIGTRPNKNLQRTIIALQGIECILRIVGPIDDEIRELLLKHKITYSQIQDISNEQIIQEYQNCDIVSFASTYEGFGMPIIEGQAVGRVVVTSDIEPMNEISNGSCPLVNPFDIESIKGGFMEAISNYDYYENLGEKNVKRFLIDDKVEEYYKIYKKL